MYLNLSGKSGKTMKIVPDYEKKTLIFELDEKNILPPDLFDFCFENLKTYKKLKIDLDSFLNLSFKKISDESIFLIFHTILSHYTNIPFSLKNTKFKSIDEYKYKSLKDKKIKSQNYEWKINCKKNISNISSLIEAQELAKQLQEMPPNLLKPEDFTKTTLEIMKYFTDKNEKNIKIKVFGNSWLKENNLNLIDAVSLGSKSQAQFLIIEYFPIKDKAPKALIGKGVCYDSGGLNIKTSSYMSNMKFDMSGAASTLATIYALAKNNSKQNLVVLIPLVENLISEKSYKADDVFISYSGKSIEIENTDAEGRLILADALSYAAKKYKPSELISIATLTGAIGYALGSKYAGAWSTEDKNWNLLFNASQKAGEFIWRMPFHDYYLKKLKNTRVADIKNSAKVGSGGASRAACFLKEFTEEIPYIHLDIANVAYSECNVEGKAPLIRTLYYYLYR